MKFKGRRIAIGKAKGITPFDDPPFSWLTDPDKPTVLKEPVEFAHSAGVNYQRTGTTAKVTLLCRWEDRNAVAKNIVDNKLLWPHYPPYTDEESMWPSLRAQSAEISHLGSEKTKALQTTLIGYDWALITVNFAVKPLYIENIEYTGEHITLPPKHIGDPAGLPGNTDLVSTFWWNDGSSVWIEVTANETPSKQLVGWDHSLDYLELTDADLTDILSALKTWPGSVNQEEMTSPSTGLVYPVETLLFQSPKIGNDVIGAFIDPPADPVIEKSSFRVQYRLSYREHGWNKFWRPKTNTYEPMYIMTSGGHVEHKVYPLKDFSAVMPDWS